MLLALGFLLVHRASSHAYLSVFGLTDSNVGYIANTAFIFSVTFSIALVSTVIYALARRGRLCSLQSPVVVPSIVACLSFLPGFLDFDGMSLSGPVFVAAGIAYALSFSLLMYAWYELFAFDRAKMAATVLVFSVLGSSLLASALSVLPSFVAQALDIAFVVIGVFVARYLRARFTSSGGFLSDVGESPENDQFEDSIAVRSLPVGVMTGVRELLIPLYALAAIELATGLLNITATGDLLNMLLNMPIWASTSLGAAMFIVMVIAVDRVQSADSLYYRIFPLLLALLLALLVIGDLMGSITGIVILIIFNFFTFSVNYSIFEIYQHAKTPIYCLLAISNLVSRVSLAAGFGLGLIFVSIANMTSAALSTIVIVFTIYILSMVALSIGKSGKGVKRCEAIGHTAVKPENKMAMAQVIHSVGATSSEDKHGVSGLSSYAQMKGMDLNGHEMAIKALITRYSLTGRESDVLEYLVRGWSAQQISSTLIISENTVWTHIKHIYAKTGTGSKQEIINMYEIELTTACSGN